MATTAPESDTRERIMTAARRLFAAKGFDGVSLREITEAARANTAAVNYHFRSKDELIRQVFEAGLKPIIAARIGALDACLAAAAGRPPALEAVAEALIRPLVELSAGEHRDTMVMLMHVRATPPSITGDIVIEQFRPVHDRFADVLQRVLPDLSRSEIAFRYDCARGAALQILVDLAPAARLVSGLDQTAPPSDDAMVRRLLAFVVAGFRAPAAPG